MICDTSSSPEKNGAQLNDFGCFLLRTEITNGIAPNTLKPFLWASYHHLDMGKYETLPSKHHCFLVVPLLPGFALNDKKWSEFFKYLCSSVRSAFYLFSRVKFHFFSHSSLSGVTLGCP